MLLELEGVSRTFGGVRAVDGAGFGVGRGQVHGLIGPNGAGKTTVINLISGLLKPSSGQIRLDGERIDTLPAYRIADLGVRRTFQNIRLFPGMSALQNVTVGQHTRRHVSLLERLWFSPRSSKEDRALATDADELLGRVGIGPRGREQASNLPYGDQRRLEVARALASDPRLLLLDEPAAGMNQSEAQGLGELVRTLARQGLTILLVEHNVRLVMEICDRITVLNFGKVIAEGTPAEVSADAAVVAAYLGVDEGGGVAPVKSLNDLQASDVEPPSPNTAERDG